MEDQTTTKNPDAIEEISSRSKKELKDAELSWKKAKATLDEVQKEIEETLNVNIRANEEIQHELLQKSKSFEQIDLSGNFASELTKSISSNDIAKYVMDAAKSINQALNSIEKTHSEIKAMEVRVNNVEVVDTKETKDIVKSFAKSTQKALKTAENCKYEAFKIAVHYSKDIKLDLDSKINEIAVLPSKIKILGKDLETIIKGNQELLKEAYDAKDQKQLKVNELQLEVLKSGLVAKQLESVTKLV